ncbi:hypothetical protein [Pseudomonas viridiflava]|uniref:GAP1-N1 domain-containing protein n=1 Tax=Pseudomonas viridiflava TaxID=33069 RepID=UPI0013CEBE57|nr:hypothetical protein [Pseudomonas viridiflava]
MADQLMSSILVHQALHGYSDGHRLISSSLPIDTSDARIMLVMSDLSGPGLKPPAGGYLTGYPLEKSGKYVFSRTWSAPEMPRPGCVWTHSLIIENSDLARLISVQPLLESFRHTVDKELKSRFAEPIAVTASSTSIGIDPTERIAALLNALYSNPTHQVVIEATDPAADEQVVTTLWMQQWPRLRRSFGFCTLSGMDRSGKGIVLDLQFVPEGDRQLRSKFPNAIVSGGSAVPEALMPLLADLAAPSASTLREFLKRIGGDVDGGRRAMLPLCSLHESLLERHPPDLVTAVSALTALDNGGRRQARSIRKLVTYQAMKQTNGRIDDAVFEFLLEMLEESNDGEEQLKIGSHLGTELWRRSPNRFRSALASQGVLCRVASTALAEMAPEQIISGLEASIVREIAELRPDIMLLPAFWKSPSINDDLAEIVPPQDAGEAVKAMLSAGRVGTAMTMINKAHTKELIRALESESADPETVRAWLAALCRDYNKLAKVLASGQVRLMTTIVTIARHSSPDDVPNSYGEDPWLIALQSASGPLNQSDENFLAAFLLSRALGWESRSQAELLQYSYTKIYKGFQDQLFSRDTEKLANSRLGRGSWLDWDSCSRLRETVVKRFIEHNLEPAIFGRLTDENFLEISLIDEAAHSKKGKAYLKRVYDALKRTEERKLKVRAEYIDISIK